MVRDEVSPYTPKCSACSRDHVPGARWGGMATRLNKVQCGKSAVLMPPPRWAAVLLASDGVGCREMT